MTEDLSAAKPSAINTISVLLLRFCGMGFSIVTPVMAYLIAHFSETAGDIQNVLPITLISTAMTLFIIFGMLVSGNIVGKVKVRVLAIIGNALFVVFGIIPAFIDNYIAVLLCRCLCGFGLGMVNPLAATVILGVYGENKQAKYAGYVTMVMNLLGLIMQTLSGILADAFDGSWQVPFYLHLLGIVPLVCSFFLPEPQNVSAKQKAKEKEAGVKKAIPATIWFFGVAFLLFQMMNYTAFLNTSTIVIERGIGAATEAAMALNMFTILGIVSGFIAGYVLKALGHFTAPAGWALCAVGIFLIYIGEDIMFMYAGMALLGLGFNFLLPILTPWVGAVTNPSQNARAMTIIMTLLQLGSFVGSYWILFCDAVFGDSLYTPMLIETFLCIVLAIIFVIMPSPFRKKKDGNAEATAA